MRTQRDEIIWGNVERLRKDKQWDYTDLADAMKVKPQSVNSLKSGVRGIGLRSLKKLATALGVDEIQLLRVDTPLPTTPSHSPDQVTMRDLLDLQKRINDLSLELAKATQSLGEEIGWIKQKMVEASESGDIHRLGPQNPPSHHFRN